MSVRPWTKPDHSQYLTGHDFADAHTSYLRNREKLESFASEMAEAILAGDALDSWEACNEYQGGTCRPTDTSPCMGCRAVWAVKNMADLLRQIGNE